MQNIWLYIHRTTDEGKLAYSTFSPRGYSGAFYYGKVTDNW
ncbi:TonB-dependent receptor [Pseudomonas batumici]|uniref:TonB-dependent receptor n=1 Tax=Pseudomonas batumici TaxID=226910 RepID=A0A0C2I765_9PSED|nr:TonB-dependent receptor [Pseudomonas batumici]